MGPARGKMRPVDLLDFILVALFILSLVRGVRLGAAMQILSFLGFWIGMIIGALIAPSLAGSFSSPFTKLLIVLVVWTVAVIGGLILVGMAIPAGS